MDASDSPIISLPCVSLVGTIGHEFVTVQSRPVETPGAEGRAKVIFVTLKTAIAALGIGTTLQNAPDKTINLGTVAALEYRDLTNQFVQHPSFAVADDPPIQEIIYGNSQYGYFSIKRFERAHGRVAFDLVPPGYQSPLKVYARTAGAPPSDRLLGTLSYPSPIPALIAANLEISREGNDLSMPFFLLDGAIAGRTVDLDALDRGQPIVHINDDRRRCVFVMIVNRYGEIVWAHFPNGARQTFDSYSIAKPLGGGRYGVMLSQKESYFEIVDYKGNVLRSLDPQRGTKPFMFHHDFWLAPDETMITFGNSRAHVRRADRPWESPRSCLGSTMLGVNLYNGTSVTLWDAFTDFNPETIPQWGPDGLKSGKFQDTWDGPNLDFDFTHANSLDFVPNIGWLISMRNISALAMLDESVSKVLWTVGSGAGNTFQVPEDQQFVQQHHATWLGDDQIMVVDNGHQPARIVELALDHSNGTARVTRDFRPSPPLDAPTRGSAFVGPHERLFGFFVGNDDEKDRAPSTMVEFDRRTGREVGRLSLHFNVHHVGYRGVPISAVGEETFMGQQLKAATPP